MSIQKVEFQPAVILHRKPFKETSLLVDMLTREYGRIAVVANGARKSRDRAGLLQPFQLLYVSWTARSDLGTLTQIELINSEEASTQPQPRIPQQLVAQLPWVKRLQASKLYCGLYLNELIIRCSQRASALEGLLELYCHSIECLLGNSAEAVVLRTFEWQLICLLGYGSSLIVTANDKDVIEDKYYYYQPGHGIVETSKGSPQAISGMSLIAFHQQQWQGADLTRDARLLTAQALRPLVGEKPFASRSLYQGLVTQNIKNKTRKS